MSADMFARLEQLEKEIARQAEIGLQQGASQAQASLKATNLHGDRTGATRAGYIAYVSGPNVDGADIFEQAAAAVNEKNPGHVERGTAGEIGGDVVLIMTVPTNYQKYLETEAGGVRGALTAESTARARQFLDGSAEAIRKAFS